MSARKDLVGNRYGRLTVIEFSYSLPNGTFWKCLCDCGNEKVLRSGDFRNGKVTSCGCYRKESAFKNPLTDRKCKLCGRIFSPLPNQKYCGPDCYAIYDKIHKMCYALKSRGGKDSSRRRFNVNDKDVLDIYYAQNKCCAICGKELELIDISADHIVPFDRGGNGEKHNLQLTHFRCNLMKNNCTTEELLEWAENVLKHHRKDENCI